MSDTLDIPQQRSIEIERRNRLAVPAFAGGFLYLLSAIIISGTLNGAPKVGLLEGIAPALRGEADPTVSPRTQEVKYISHHALPLISGSVMAAIAIGALTLTLLLLHDATRFRRVGTWAQARLLVTIGGFAVATVSVLHQVISAFETHKFAVGHDFTNHAVEQAITQSTLNLVVEYIALLAGLALAVGMIVVMVNALRVGLVPRWLGILGMFTGLLILLPLGGAELQLVPALWMVMMGILLIGRWPGGEPPAWAAGEARPWPTGAQVRAEKRGEVAPSGPAPTVTRPPSSRKRRKRSGSS